MPIDDSFFSLGGDSVIGVQVNASMKQDLKIDIPIAKLFQLATIRNIVNYHRILNEVLSIDALSPAEVDGILETYADEPVELATTKRGAQHADA